MPLQTSPEAPSRKIRIEQRLTALFSPQRLEVIDESAAHAGHAGAVGGESHFRVRMVAAQFAEKTRIARHRMIHDALAPIFADGLHALAIEAAAPGEPARW